MPLLCSEPVKTTYCTVEYAKRAKHMIILPSSLATPELKTNRYCDFYRHILIFVIAYTRIRLSLPQHTAYTNGLFLCALALKSSHCLASVRWLGVVSCMMHWMLLIRFRQRNDHSLHSRLMHAAVALAHYRMQTVPLLTKASNDHAALEAPFVYDSFA